VGNLNELEAIDGEIWANVWLTDCIARVDPQSGVVKCVAAPAPFQSQDNSTTSMSATCRLHKSAVDGSKCVLQCVHRVFASAAQPRPAHRMLCQCIRCEATH